MDVVFERAHRRCLELRIRLEVHALCSSLPHVGGHADHVRIGSGKLCCARRVKWCSRQLDDGLLAVVFLELCFKRHAPCQIREVSIRNRIDIRVGELEAGKLLLDAG